MPALWHGRPLKRWRYVGAFGPEVLLCAAVARIGIATVAWWAVWDRERRILAGRTHRSARKVVVERGRVEVADGPVRIALVGNSHAGHWLPALQLLAGRQGWTISTFLASRCNATDAPLELGSEARTQNCLAYGDWVMEQTKGSKFDLVITSERQSVPVQGESWGTTKAPAVAGYESYLRQWARAGTRVLVVKDPPYPGTQISNIPDCLASNPGNPAACAGTPSSWHWMDPLDEAARQLSLPGISRVSMDKYFCAGGVCPAAIGSVVTYRDGSHITATYAASLAPYLAKPIDKALSSPRPGAG